MKILIFGAGYNGRICKEYIENNEQDVLAGFLDNAEEKPSISDKNGQDIPVYSPDAIAGLEYDLIIISNINPSQIREIQQQLRELNVPESKVQVLFENKDLLTRVMRDSSQYCDEAADSRVSWLRNYAQYVNEKHLPGNVAECGVWMGDFARFINKYFPDKTLYLFDTFTGFDSRDLEKERNLGDADFLSGAFNDNQHFSAVVLYEHVVLAKMIYPERCVLKKGYFPDTAEGLEDQFCFVNLDMDLYQPMLEGLRFFYERMCDGGVILLHDYFHPELPGVRRAVADFERERQEALCKVPIGDFCSIAVIRY